MRALRAFAGTVVAVFGGWLAGILVAAVWAGAGSAAHSGQFDASAVTSAAGALATYSPWFIAPIWLVVLIPLYFLVPSSSVLWRLPLCTVLGCLPGCWLLQRCSGLS